MACVAKYDVNGRWYRAKIARVMDSLLDVSFVDYGNVQTTPLSLVKAIGKEFLQLPPQAYKCCLDVADRMWTPEDIHRFKSSATEKRFWAKFTPRDNNPNLAVVLEEFRYDGLTICINNLFGPRNKRPNQQVKLKQNKVFYYFNSTFVFTGIR